MIHEILKIHAGKSLEIGPETTVANEGINHLGEEHIEEKSIDW